MKTVRRLALAVGVLIVALFGVLFVNALRVEPKSRAHDRRVAPSVPATRIAEHLAQAVRFPTISHQDPAQDDRSAFAALHAWLESTYPRVHKHFEREQLGTDALLYRWQGSDPAAKPVLFMAHQDVVPVEPGTEAGWTHPPFAGVIADGYVWGRGALDDKAMLIALFEACESLLAEGFVPARSVFLALGSDEEVGGNRGAKLMAAELARRAVRFEWVLDEGGAITRGVVPFVTRPVGTIAVGEKGYLSLELIAHAEGGHSSMPPTRTAIGALARAITRLEQHPFEPHLSAPLREGFGALAGEVPFWPRLVLANLWLTEPLLAWAVARSTPVSRSSVRTTIAPTIIDAGVKDNVLPATARAVVNFRIQPGESIAGVIEHTRASIDDPRIEIRTVADTAKEPVPLSDTRARSYLQLRAAVEELWPDAVMIPTVVNGGTDARHMQAVSDAVYHFAPWTLEAADLKRIHGTDERVQVEQLGRGVELFRELLRGTTR